jgi:hypothetical protein
MVDCSVRCAVSEQYTNIGGGWRHMILTEENANQFLGKSLDAKNRVFHYYPLQVVKRKTGYHVIDRHDTMMLIPREKEGGIFFDKVLEL